MYKKSTDASVADVNLNSESNLSDKASGIPLFVSSFVPWNKELLSIGIAQRLLVMLEAACKQWGVVNVTLLSNDPNADSTESKDQAIGLIRQATPYPINIKILKIEAAHKKLHPAIASFASYFRPDSPPFTVSQNSLQELQKLVYFINPKAIFAHRLITFRALRMAGIAKKFPTYLDLDDIEHIARYRAVSTPPLYRTKKLGMWHCLPLALEERAAGKICKQVQVCSNIDLTKMKRLQPLGNYIVTPNSVSLPPQSLNDNRINNKIDVLFVGALTYTPNIAGLQWFVNKVWASVLQLCPDARLVIAGKGGEQLKISHELLPTVRTLGYVTDITQLYRRAALSICPLLSGGGTRIKIIESAAHGVPVASTTIGAEGLNFQDGDSIIIRDTPRDFSAAVANLLINKDFRQKLSTNSRKVFMDHYERQSVIDRLSKSLALSATKST